MSNSPGKYLLSICIVLFSAYCFFHAGAVLNGSKPGFVSESNTLLSFNSAANGQQKITTKATPVSGDFIKICTEKNEEEIGRPVFSRAYTHSSIYFTSVQARSVQVLSFNFRKQLQDFAHWFLSSSHRFGALGVLRL